MFLPHRGTTFTLATGGEEVALALVAVEPLPTPAGGTERTPFSLEFLGPADPAFAQATFPLKHAELGALELFAVPIARTAEGTRYQAIFT